MTFGSRAKSIEVRSEKSVASAEAELSSLRQCDHHLLTYENKKKKKDYLVSSRTNTTQLLSHWGYP